MRIAKFDLTTAPFDADDDTITGKRCRSVLLAAGGILYRRISGACVSAHALARAEIVIELDHLGEHAGDALALLDAIYQVIPRRRGEQRVYRCSRAACAGDTCTGRHWDEVRTVDATDGPLSLRDVAVAVARLAERSRP
jgi:hypothetical protein